MSAVVQVKDLSKRYYIGKKQSGSLRETLSHVAGNLFSKTESEEFWALKDVSFEVQQGEVLGIIGKNGAGKSTLLKVLSRITEPTTGSVVIDGRVSSLLEVGTGFHPELTGRENIFLNGAILGMKRTEIRKKFDEIVAFSGIEQFIDTPVKRYSSGMYVRLAFAVAAHLEPEILIIDEVLAVGDAEFQKKCLGKMKDVSEQQGRTVIFVSHNMAAIQALCNKAIMLRKGAIFKQGATTDVITTYSQSLSGEEAMDETGDGIFQIKDHHTGSSHNFIHSIKTYCDGRLSSTVYSGCRFRFDVSIENYKLSRNIMLGFVVKDNLDRPFVALNNHHLNIEFNNDGAEDFELSYQMNHFPFSGNSRLYVDLYFGDGITDYEVLRNAFHVELQPSNFYHSSAIPDPSLNTIVIGDITGEILLKGVLKS